MTAPRLIATSELVAQAWIRGIPGLTADGVGGQLPAAEREWARGGYIVVPVTVGGTPMDSGPVQRPVVQVECWATNPGSARLPWLKAVNLAEQVRLAAYDRTYASPRPLNLGAGYPTGWVRAVKPMTHPKRVWSDEGDYAGYVFDLYLMWVAAGEALP